MAGGTVLVTGGSGFIGGHCIVRALEAGYTVRTTLRSLTRAEDVRTALRNGGVSEEKANQVQFYAADLTDDSGWDEACQGCDYVLHVASPFPAGTPKNEDDLIVPARDGTLRALRAAKAAGTVKRVVVTSSFAAIGYGHSDGARNTQNPFTESDWTILENPKSAVGPYEKSKTIAERAAWEFIKTDGAGMELATVNPVGVFGPVLGKDSSTSLELIIRLLSGQVPGLPHLSLGVVDVRDVADLHLRAMVDPRAAGQRYLAISDELSVSMKDIAMILKQGLPPDDSRKVPTRSLPTIVLRFAAFFDSAAALIVPHLDKIRPTSNAKAKTELGWEPRSAKVATIASAESLKQYGLVKL